MLFALLRAEADLELNQTLQPFIIGLLRFISVNLIFYEKVKTPGAFIHELSTFKNAQIPNREDKYPKIGFSQPGKPVFDLILAFN